MASSRTGTSQWLKVRAQAIRLARANGLNNCPFCGVLLDYDQSRTPASAEPDHIVPHCKGGQDVLENVQICCRKCNQSKGARRAPKPATVMASKPLKVSRLGARAAAGPQGDSPHRAG